MLGLGMRFTHLIQSRKVRIWVLLIVCLVMVSLITAVLSLSRRPSRPFEVDDLYGWLD
jgi:hypothetical protein